MTLTNDEDYWANRLTFDPKAFEHIYDLFLVKVTRYIYQKTRDQAMTEDITSKVFIKVLESSLKGNYAHRGKFLAWLFTIVRTTLAEHYRDQATSPASIELSDELFVSGGSEESFDKLPILEKCFNELDENERELLALRFSGELDFKTIGVLLHKSTAAVKMATYRSMMKLRTKMEKLHEQEI